MKGNRFCLSDRAAVWLGLGLLLAAGLLFSFLTVCAQEEEEVLYLENELN